MTDVAKSCPEAALLTKPNIIHPSTVAAVVAADEARARLEIAQRLSVTSVTGGSIKTGT